MKTVETPETAPHFRAEILIQGEHAGVILWPQVPRTLGELSLRDNYIELLETCGASEDAALAGRVGFAHTTLAEIEQLPHQDGVLVTITDLGAAA